MRDVTNVGLSVVCFIAGLIALYILWKGDITNDLLVTFLGIIIMSGVYGLIGIIMYLAA